MSILINDIFFFFLGALCGRSLKEFHCLTKIKKNKVAKMANVKGSSGSVVMRALTFHQCGFDASLSRPVSRKPLEVFAPVNPFLIDLYQKTERRIRLKFLV